MLVDTRPSAPRVTPAASPARPGPAADGSPPAPPAAVAARQQGLDALKVALIALVVVHHAGQAYGPTGGYWPYMEASRAPILGTFFYLNASFFMGLFFLLSALFVPGSFDRKGALGFLRDRLVRLGVPLAVFAAIVYAGYVSQGGPADVLPFLRTVFLGDLHAGHLWFVIHLLAYALLYALLCTGWRRIARPRGPVYGHEGRQQLNSAAILGFVLALAASTYLVRVVFPIDRWLVLAGIVPAEPAHLPQYAGLFLAGLVAARRGWVASLPARTGRIWLGIGAGVAALVCANALAGQPLPWVGGGAGWPAAAWSTLEAFLAVGLSIGLVAAFREAVRGAGRLQRATAPNAYAVYLIHPIPVIALQASLGGVPLPPLAKFALVSMIAVPLCFALAAALRRLPGVRAVL